MRTRKKGERRPDVLTSVIYVRVTPVEHDTIMKMIARQKISSAANLGRNLLMAWAEGKVATP